MSETLEQILPDQILDAFDRLRGDTALFDLTNFSFIELRGEDRKGWLQGQATNDLKQLDIGASTSFCICQPTGQILAICDIWGLKDRFILSCERSAASAVMLRIDQMVILEDVQARDLTEELRAFSIQGPNATEALAEIVDLPTLDSADGQIGSSEAVVLRSNRTGLGGWDVLLQADAKVEIAQVENAFVKAPGEVFEIARIEAGIPRIDVDVDGKTFPPELGQAFEARHVSYKKGCYTGQEVLMRIHSRGHTNRSWMGLMADHQISEGELLFNRQGKEVGKVTSACYSPDYGYIGGAMIRNESALEGEVVFMGEGRTESTLRQMPILRFD